MLQKNQHLELLRRLCLASVGLNALLFIITILFIHQHTKQRLLHYEISRLRGEQFSELSHQKALKLELLAAQEAFLPVKGRQP